MADKRKRPTSGVGRGNGEGSQKTQFREGMPSGNPAGRPRRPKRVPNSSIKDAVQREMKALVTTHENGVSARHSSVDAMIKVLFARFPTATIRDQIALLRFLVEVVPEAMNEVRHEIPAETIQKIFEEFAVEAARETAVEQD